MKSKMAWLMAMGLLTVVPLAADAQLVSIPMDAQINLGYTYNVSQSPNGDAIYVPPFSASDTQEFIDDFNRHHCTGGAWWYHYIDLNLAGITTPGTGLDLSGPCTRIEFDARFYQDPVSNSNPYGDAPIFLRIYNYAANGDTYQAFRDYGIIYGQNATRFPYGEWYPNWAHVVVYVDNAALNAYTQGAAAGQAFTIANVSRIRFYGTDWAGTGDDFVDFRNFQIWNTIPAPTIAEVTPDPDPVYPNIPYSRQLNVSSCDPNVTWALLPPVLPGLTIDQSGLVSGWTPGPGDAGQTFDITAQATNGGGSGVESWQVLVKTPPVLDGSNVAPPWGTVNANISGTQSSNAASMILSANWGKGTPEVDWVLDVAGAGLERPAHRSSITFDEEGNLYFKSANGFLASVDPTGTLRWTGHVGGTPFDLGIGDGSSPVVGDGGPTGRVYALTDDGIAAFRKSDGERLWLSPLPGSNWAGTGARLTPALYNGALYAVGAGTTTKTVFGINGADGEVIWSREVPVGLGGDVAGSMTLVPEAFGAGVHGLYFNGDSGSGSDGKAEMYAIALDTNSFSAVMQWSTDGGKVARSHVIYVESAGRVGTHCWDDYGAGFYSWDLDGTHPVSTSTAGGAKHGWEDFGALDFDGNDVLSGSFDGRIARYQDVSPLPAPPTEVVYDSAGFEPLNLGDLPGQDGWAEDTSDPSYGKVQVVADPTGAGMGKVMLIDPPGTAGGWLGVVRAAGITKTLVTMEWDQWRADTSDNLWIADNAAYDGWYAIGWDLSGNLYASGFTGGVPQRPGRWQHVKYTFNLLTGQVLLESAGRGALGVTTDTTLDGIDFEVEPTEAGTPAEGGPTYIDNVVIKQGDATTDPLGLSGTGWYQMESDFGENRGNGGLYQNESGASIYVASTSTSFMNAKIVGFDATNSTLYTDAPPQDEQPRWFEYDTNTADHPRGGPVLGPAGGGAPQHIYYFEGGSHNLVALRARQPLPGDFDDDGDVDTDDLIPFVNCDEGPMVPVTDPECAEEDMNDDGFVDMLDFAAWQNCYSGPDNPGDPDCYP